MVGAASSPGRRLAGLGVVLLAATLGFQSIQYAAAGRAEAAVGCLVSADYTEDVDGPLTPGRLAVDAALNRDVEDETGPQVQTIHYPDEAGLWAATAAASGATLVMAASASAPRETLPPTGPTRQDRSVSDSIVRLYCGLFDRLPDPFELDYWASRYWNGLPLVSIAEAFTTSEEFLTAYGSPSDAGLVALLYDSVLGRVPGAGADSFVDAVNDAELSRGALIVSFTESAEYVAMTNTVRPVKPDLPYPNEGMGKRIIYSNGEQRVWLVEASGELTKTHLVSGRRGVPAAGEYEVYSKSRHASAPYKGITMEYMVRYTFGINWPLGFHSIPVRPDKTPLQTIEQLGTHRSAGCSRQHIDDAEFVFRWADLGTKVIVTP
jgi:hypothetical protein